jgi:hypothetical protein
MITTAKDASSYSHKKVALIACLSAVITAIFCLLTPNAPDQREKIRDMESRINTLEALLVQKENELQRARYTSPHPTDQVAVATNHKAATRESLANTQPLASATDETPINTYQIMRDLGTQSVSDPRSFTEKVNDFLSDNPTKAKIAIASKSVFDMAHDRDNLPDYALQAIYNHQTDPDLKRVIAQVLSMRGNNSLIDNQISEAQLYLSSENPADRQQALTTLAKTHYVNAANSIAPLLQDPDINVKLDALLAIGATGNQTHVHMVEKLLSDPDPAVSSLASDVVSNLRNLSEIARTTLSTADVAAELIPIETM